MNRKPIIDETLVHGLVSTQFPQWKDLEIRAVTHSGWDNRTFHLGKQMLVRIPSAEEYALQVEKEQQWLPMLAPLLPLPIPIPLGLGEPTNDYPRKWSIYSWLPGETVTASSIDNLNDFSADLAQFLTALQHIDSTNGPPPGPHMLGPFLKTRAALFFNRHFHLIVIHGHERELGHYGKH